MQSNRRGSLKLDIASAYVLSASRMGSWLGVAAIAFRHGRELYTLLALVRSTLGLLNYFALGVGPAVIYLFTRQAAAPVAAIPLADATKAGTLQYASPGATPIARGSMTEIQFRIFANAKFATLILCTASFLALAVYWICIWRIHDPVGYSRMSSEAIEHFALFFGLGLILRIRSEPNSAVLQASGYLAIDNFLQAGAEIAWVALTGLMWNYQLSVGAAGNAFFLSSIGLHYARRFAMSHLIGRTGYAKRDVDRAILTSVLIYGAMTALAQLADFLYAPTDFILINRLLRPDDLTAYAPAVQVDSAILLSVTALAAALLPRAAIHHGRGDLPIVRKYYVRGTLASASILIVVAIFVYFLSPLFFRLWLHDPMPATQAILPLILIHTIIGGSSAVGRSILLAVGKVKPFTIAVLVAGTTNVILSYTFVRFFHLGLRGIIYGTIVAVVLRCGIWMPWYVMRTLRRGHIDPENSVDVQPVPEVV